MFKQVVVRAAHHSIAGQFVSVLLQLAAIALLSRLLLREDFGLVAISSAVIAFLGIFRDAGLAIAVVQGTHIDDRQISNIHWISIGLGCALYLLIRVSSDELGALLGDARLVAVLNASALVLPIGGLGASHGAILQRDLKFGHKVVAQLVGALSTLLCGVALAIMGFAYWSLVVGQVIGALITAVLWACFSGFRPSRPRELASTMGAVRFGASVTVIDLVNSVQRNFDSVLIGKILGAADVGIYSRAYQLLMFPINNLRVPVGAVAISAFSRIKDRDEQLRLYFLRAVSAIAMVTMPLVALLWACSDSIVFVVLGPSWSAVSPIFDWLAITAFIQPTSGFVGTLLLSIGQPGRLLYCAIGNTAVVVVASAVGIAWGLEGFVIGYSLGNAIITMPWISFALSRTPIRPSEFFKVCRFPASASIIAGAAGYTVARISEELSPVAEAFAVSLVFILTYMAVAMLIGEGRAAAKDLVELLASKVRFHG